MRAIWKFPLSDLGKQWITMPVDAEILAVQVQHGAACLWALVSPDAATAMRCFHVYGTGHRIEEKHGRYIGTFQVLDGALVFHVFEDGR